MMPGKGRLPALSAALAGIPAGVQTVGPWTGRRQLFVRFAREAETATIYTAAALRNEVARLRARSRYHSIAIVGPDVLAEAEFLSAAFPEQGDLPVMLDHDGQRPEALEGLLNVLSLVQVTISGAEPLSAIERACWTMAIAGRKQVPHAVVIAPADSTGDSMLYRIVEQIHQASADTQIVVHPAGENVGEYDRRWGQWLEKASAAHGDVRVLPRWPVAQR